MRTIFLAVSFASGAFTDGNKTVPEHKNSACSELYNTMELDSIFNPETFRLAATGSYKITGHNEALTLIDFSRPSAGKLRRFARIRLKDSSLNRL